MLEVERLRSLRLHDRIELARAATDNKSYLELRFTKEAVNDPDAIQFKRLLRLELEKDRFRLFAGIGVIGKESIAVATRTLIGVMNYLAQGVEVPTRDFSAGRVTRTRRHFHFYRNSSLCRLGRSRERTQQLTF